MSTKVGDIIDAAFPNILMAATAEEAGQVYDQMIQDCENAGLAMIEDVANQKYQAKMEAWGN